MLDTDCEMSITIEYHSTNDNVPRIALELMTYFAKDKPEQLVLNPVVRSTQE